MLLNIAYHTALHIGSGRLVQAAGNEKGGITGGKPGDQTGGEIGTAAYYDYPWDCILRYTGDDAGTEPDPGGTYTVQAGDTLSGIALRLLGDAQRYKELAALNKLADPSKIYPGQVLTLPGGGTETGKGEITLPGDTGGRRGRRGAVPAASFNSQVGHLLRRRRRRRGIWPGHGSCRAKLSDGPKAGRHRRRGRGHLAGPSGLRNHCRGENPLNQGGRGDLKSSRAFCGAWANGAAAPEDGCGGASGCGPDGQKAAKAKSAFPPMPAENAVFLCLICGTYAICPYCRHKTDGLEHFNFIKMMDINQNHHFFGFVHVCRCLQ